MTYMTLLIVWIMSLVVVPAVGWTQDKSAPEKVRIAVATSSMAFLVPFVAKDRGLYLKNGADVELIQMRPNISMAALLSGDIDYAELIGSVIRSAAKGLPMRAISTGIKAPFFSFVAQNKFKSMKDLKGAVIGITSIGGTNQVSSRMRTNAWEKVRTADGGKTRLSQRSQARLPTRLHAASRGKG